MSKQTIDEFVVRWKSTGGSEHANYQLFVIELADLLGVDRPNPATDDDINDHYRFERPVTFATHRRSTGFIDVYKSGHFILETKQGVSQKKDRQGDLSKGVPERKQKRIGHGVRGTAAWDDTMLKARNQADNYARAIAKEDGWPPFLIIVDVGHVIELYADFSRQGQGYNQFPDGNRYRISIDDLQKEETLDLLHTIWIDPFSLDPSLKAAEVTREIAGHLAELGKSFEGQGHDSETVARFLMRCLFSMFAEDVDLIPRNSFKELLRKLRGHPEHAKPSLQGLWEVMNTGGFSQVLMQDLKRFNGGLFKDADALPLNSLQLGLLIEAAEADWKQVEPAIFGTLLERAIDKKQRHKLGAHYTPRSYVERLITPTIIEPLREDWRDVQTAVQRLTQDGKRPEALVLVRNFHAHLCEIRVLDPACGSGNFLYVALEMMKRLEGEITALIQELGDTKPLITVDPHQFLGIELNPWAANVAELVLWIGYLQWHFRTHGTAAPAEPVLRDFKNIKNADAVLKWEQRVPLLDENDVPVTRWDGVTTIRHKVTGEDVPDQNAKVPVFLYTNPSATVWPRADFIVGNPPFIGLRNLRKAYADGYLEALRLAYPNVAENADYVMYWWEKAANRAREFDPKGKSGTRRFGLITTNSMKQSFNRAITARHLADAKKPLSLLFAIPDHPWIDASDGAAVRIAMSVGAQGQREGRLLEITGEIESDKESEGVNCTFTQGIGTIYSDLRIGVDILSAKRLASNLGMACVGYQLTGQGFLIEPAVAARIAKEEKASRDILKPWLGGLGIQRRQPSKVAIDVCNLTLAALRTNHPIVFQHLSDTVLPQRQIATRKPVRERWWMYEESRNTFRPALKDVQKMIVTSLTASNRIFVFAPSNTIADSTTVIFALDKGEHLAVLSSKFHITWCLNSGGTLENRPRYNKSVCFDPFPFPIMDDEPKLLLRALGEELDTHRKRQQAKHPDLTLTQMYNVLERLRAGEAIRGRDKEIYDQGLIGTLHMLHNQIDAAVAEAYGWPVDLLEKEMLGRLVALNAERAESEGLGNVHWMRPAFQDPAGQTTAKDKQVELDIGPIVVIQKSPWPKSLPEQIAAVRQELAKVGEATAEQIARKFVRARSTAVEPLLESLTALGQAKKIEEGRYAA
ncbi:class I SAM-dependent DNA methyltransferase (plasmid) [Agrobacterium rosae]|uniref:class I SAM-dependent DNA methyltransferase n=1 Tax=Agrobacterium rosae TaxID=1972867 RepID=UPI002A0FFF99|nr:DNA methyltransferase [Agrobacterium rosae]MDX8316041.1 class I SAM-dependent DNA methyltransferase [Agrobacterium rosae]